MYQARLLKFFYLYAFVLVEYYFLYSKEAQIGFLIHLQSIVYWIYKDKIVFTISCLSNSIWCYFSPLREVSIHITLAYCLEAPPPHLHHGTNAYILIFHKLFTTYLHCIIKTNVLAKFLQKYHTAWITKFFQRLTVTQRNSTH